MDDTPTRRKPKFLLTSFSVEERKAFSKKIKRIGGILYESSTFTPLATHIVCKLPSRSEKFICACASGKWILSESYINESYKQNQWLDERPYEWSSSDIKEDSPNKELFLLPRKWRKQFTSQNGAFNNWNVVLVLKDKKRKEAFKRLIEAGNGCVMNIKTPYNGRHIKMIKYVISDDINCKKLLPFKRAHVPVIDSEVVIEYIITGKKPNGIMHQGVIDTITKKDSSPCFPHDMRKEVASSFAHFQNKISNKKPTRRQKKMQTSVTDFFNGLKNEYCLSPGDYQSDRNGDSSPHDSFCVDEKLKSSKRRKTGVSQNKDHSVHGILNSDGKICLKDLHISVSNCSDKQVMEKEFDKVDCLEELKANFSPVEKNVSCGEKACKTAQPPSFKKLCCNMDNSNIKSNTSFNMTLAGEQRYLNESNSYEETPSVNFKKTNILEWDAVPPIAIDLTNSRSFKENFASKQETVDAGKTVQESQPNARRKSPRKRKQNEVNMDALCTNSDKEPRQLRSKVTNTCNAAESPMKKPKIVTDSFVQKTEHQNYATILGPASVDSVNRRRVPLHRFGIDTIEGCLEEGLVQEAVKIMGSYLSPTFYLNSNMITALLKILRLPSDDFDEVLLFSVRSLLGRCIVLHPPQAIPDVYLEAFKIAGESMEVVGSNSTFEYIISVYREAQSVLKEADNVIRKQSILGLAKIITAILETDFDFHWKWLQADTSHMSDRKPILNQILGCHMEKFRNGKTLKELIILAIDVAIESAKNQEMVLLRTMVFSLLSLVAKSCQMSDVINFSSMYGQACTDFTSELYEVMSNTANNTSAREEAINTIFYCLKPSWLAARLADLFISTYDDSCVKGEARQLLQKPLSLEKIISCYFIFIPTDSNGNIYSCNQKNSSKPTAVASQNETEPVKMNVKSTGEKKIIRNPKGETKLHTACIRNKLQDVKDLLMNGMDPNIKDNAGWTALHEASNHGHASCVAELLTSKDLDIFAVGLDGYTALHDAAENHHLEVVKLLVKSGGMALLRMKTDSNLTAFDLARTEPMKSLLFQLENELECNDFHSLPYPTLSFVKTDDINQFLRLLAILLRHFVSESEDQLNLTARTKQLKDHIDKIQERKTNRSEMLLNIINSLLV